MGFGELWRGGASKHRLLVPNKHEPEGASADAYGEGKKPYFVELKISPGLLEQNTKPIKEGDDSLMIVTAKVSDSAPGLITGYKEYIKILMTRSEYNRMKVRALHDPKDSNGAIKYRFENVARPESCPDADLITDMAKPELARWQQRQITNDQPTQTEAGLADRLKEARSEINGGVDSTPDHLDVGNKGEVITEEPETSDHQDPKEPVSV